MKQCYQNGLSRAAVLCACGLAATANASLVIDVRAVSGTGGAAVVNHKFVDVRNAVPGATVVLDVFALITGLDSNPNNEALVKAEGSFLSSGPDGGPGRGNLAASAVSPFTASGTLNGTITDLDGDGDLDVGSNTPAVVTGYFRAVGPQDAAHLATGPVLRIATLTLNLTSTAVDSGEISLSVVFRPRESPFAASWYEDGSQITGSNYSAGPNVVFAIPEPASAIAACTTAALGLLARGRSRRTLVA